ncbi:hypothetical protein ACFZDK_53400 [Streptomyces sp. NPDC007901]|uniref:hypothetical protein n=1 Tax=Streptomyces sp. NPDC007901 TaxID=3364785 RepID=UPI0036EECE4F
MAEPGNGTGAGESPSPWLRTGFVLAAAFVGFVAVIGGAVVITSGGSEDGSAASATPTGGAADAPADTDTGPGTAADISCPALSDHDQEVPETAPSGVSWSLYDAVALPASRTAGPAVAGKDVARCYAHTPVGALLASSQISVRYLAADDWRSVTRTQTVGAGRDAYIADRTTAEKTAAPDEESTTHGQIAGYRFVTYHDSTAVIDTVWRFPGGQMQAATTTVLWHEGDWRLEFPAVPAAPTPVDSLAGYVPWGGV